MKSKIDRIQDRRLAFARPFVRLWMKFDAKRIIYNQGNIDFDRQEPYILLANHTMGLDVVHLPLTFKKVPYIITNELLLTKKIARFFLTKVAHTIPKSKGRSDAAAVLELMKVIKRGYPVLIFPEGDRTFFGDTGKIDISTMKFIKKMNIDVMTCRVENGFLSQPRWANGKRGNRQIELHFEIAIPKEQVANLSLEQINDIITSKLAHNAYHDQRIKMIPHPGKRLAEGLENVMYVCPFCTSINSIRTQGNRLWCASCHHEGVMNQYGFIENFRFDNLVDWNQYQLQYKDILLNSRIETKGELIFINPDDGLQHTCGQVNIVYEQSYLYLKGIEVNEKIPINQVEGAAMVLKRSLGFLYDNRYFLLKFENFGLSILRVLQDRF